MQVVQSLPPKPLSKLHRTCLLVSVPILSRYGGMPPLDTEGIDSDDSDEEKQEENIPTWMEYEPPLKVVPCGVVIDEYLHEWGWCCVCIEGNEIDGLGF